MSRTFLVEFTTTQEGIDLYICAEDQDGSAGPILREV